MRFLVALALFLIAADTAAAQSFGDGNGDGLVNGGDFAQLEACMTGPIGAVAPGCEVFVTDGNAPAVGLKAAMLTATSFSGDEDLWCNLFENDRGMRNWLGVSGSRAIAQVIDPNQYAGIAARLTSGPSPQLCGDTSSPVFRAFAFSTPYINVGGVTTTGGVVWFQTGWIEKRVSLSGTPEYLRFRAVYLEISIGDGDNAYRSYVAIGGNLHIESANWNGFQAQSLDQPALYYRTYLINRSLGIIVATIDTIDGFNFGFDSHTSSSCPTCNPWPQAILSRSDIFGEITRTGDRMPGVAANHCMFSELEYCYGTELTGTWVPPNLLSTEYETRNDNPAKYDLVRNATSLQIWDKR